MAYSLLQSTEAILHYYLYLLASDTYSLDEMNEIVSVVRPHIDFQPLDTVTNIDINQFYEIFRDEDTNCVATNVKFQLP